MEPKRTIMLLAVVGLFAGGYLPVLWGGSSFSFTSILLSGLGGFLGIYIGYKLTR